MKQGPIDTVLEKTKDLKFNVMEKTKDFRIEIKKVLTTRSSSSIQTRIVFACSIIVIVYFAIMDILTYFHIQNLPVRTKDPEPINTGFDYFKMLSIKGMMEDQLSCHINWPTCEWFEQVTHISQLKFVTPNRVSILGAIIAIPAGKLLAAESLLAKRIAILIFTFRLWIDGLDGIVFRMQKFSGAKQHTQLSVRHSSGWWMDFFCDSFAALTFLYGTYFTIKQNMPSNGPSNLFGYLPLNHCPPKHIVGSSSPRPSSPNLERSEKEISYRTLWTKVLWVVATIFFGSGLWDYFVAQYRAIFEVTFKTEKQQVLQNKFLKSGSTFIVFWFWRLFNGVSLINTAYLAIVVDKIWDYVNYVQFFGSCGLLCLSLMTLLHLNSLHNALGLYGTY